MGQGGKTGERLQMVTAKAGKYTPEKDEVGLEVA